MLDEDERTETGSGVDAGIDQVEAYANDPANGSASESDGKDFVGDLKERNQDSGRDGGAAGGNRFQQFAGKLGSGAKKHKKGLAIGGGIGAALIGILLSILAFLPLKLESILANIIAKEGSRVDNAIEKRTEKIVLTYLAQRAGVDVGSGVVVDGGILKTLYANWSKQGFDKKLADRGIKVEKGSARGRIKVIANGNATEYGSLDEFVDKDLSSSDARRFFRAAVEDQTKIIQVLRRRHMRRWLQNATGVKKWKVFDRKTGKEATTELDEALDENVNGKLKADIGKDADCATEGKECPTNDETRNLDGVDTERGDVTVDSTTPSCGEGKDKKPDADCTKDLSDPENEDKKGLVSEGLDKYGGKVGEKLSAIIESEVTKKVLAAGLGLGAVNLLADLDNSLYNNSFGKLIELRRGEQYAATFASWAIIADEIKDGQTVSGDEVNAAMTKLNGSEKAQASSILYNGDSSKGTPVSDDDKVGSGGNEGTANSISTFYRANFGFLHGPLQAYKNSVGGVFGFVSGLIGKALNPLIEHIPGLSNLTDLVSTYLTKLLNYVLGTVVDGSEVGPKLLNAIYVGAEVTYNGFARDSLGAPKVDSTTAIQIDNNIALDNDALQRKLPLTDRLFSIDNPNSLVSKVALVTPATPSAAMSATGSFVASLATNPVKYFSNIFEHTMFKSVLAADDSIDDIGGVTQYAYTNAQLAAPLDLPDDTNKDGKIDENDCPVVKDANQENLCLLDTAAAVDLTSLTTTDDDGGVGDGEVSGMADTTSDGNSGDATTTGGDAAALATQLLNDKNYVPVGAGVKKDLTATAAGKTINNSDTCGKTISLDPVLLQMMITATTLYKIQPINIVTGHGCDKYYHPKGKATDIDFVTDLKTGDKTNFTPGTAGDNQTLDRQFVEYIATIMPASGGGLGQAECAGRTGAKVPKRVTFFNDTCTHQHVDLGSY